MQQLFKKVLKEIAEGAKNIGQKLGLLAPATAPALINGDLGAQDFLRDDQTQPSQDLSSSVAGTKLLNNSLDQTTEREADETKTSSSQATDTNREKSQRNSFSEASKKASLKTLLKPSLESILETPQKEIVDQANAAKQSCVNPAFKISIEAPKTSLRDYQSAQPLEQAHAKNVPEFTQEWKKKIEFWELRKKQTGKHSEDILNKARELKSTTFDLTDVLELSGMLKSEIDNNAQKTYHHWKFTNCRARIYKAKGDIPSFGIKEGQFFYLDLSDVGAQGHYGDHIEIFNSNKIACEVRNLDGTKDDFKTKVALNLIDNDGKARPIDEQLPIDIIDGSLKSKFYENNGCEDCINDFKI